MDIDFDELVAEGYARLPEWVRKKIKNVALLMEDEPNAEDREEQELGPNDTLLGLYKGTPLSRRGENYGVGPTMPDTITLYRLPILDLADDEVGADASDEIYIERVRQIVADTVWHEFAHHFGMDEAQVRSREATRHTK